MQVCVCDFPRHPLLDETRPQVIKSSPAHSTNEGDPDFELYSSRCLEIPSYEGCVMWGNRIVVPPPGRQAVLQELHEGHPGMSK